MTSQADSGKSYHQQCTGPALETVIAHSGGGEDVNITLFASCFCPFVQRVWIALEFFGIPYKVNEVDPYKKPKDLLQVSPKGLVPAITITGEGTRKFEHERSLHESTVILEYLQGLAALEGNKTLLPPSSHPYIVALCRLQADHVSRAIVPTFYRYLQAQTEADQSKHGKEFYDALEDLVKLFERSEREVAVEAKHEPGLAASLGLWVEGGELGLVDVLVAPWLFRATIVLRHYRGLSLPQSPKFNAWLERLLNHPAVKKTCSTEELYIESYERYARNRPNTSLVANAINEGRTLP